MTPLEISLITALVPFIVALTAWLRAELAHRTAASAAGVASRASTAAITAIARTNRLVPPGFPQGGVPVRPDLPPDVTSV